MAIFVCSNCGETSTGWMGRCSNCQQWNTFVEHKESGKSKKEQVQKMNIATLSKIPSLDTTRKPTGLFEFDRVLGGGLVAGEVVLITGEPGIGKSTLLLQGLKNLKTLYVSGEESASQVKDRAIRLGISVEHIWFSDTLQIEAITTGIEDLVTQLDVLVIDSIQTVYSKDIDGTPGTITQLRECSAKLIRFAKEKHIPVVIVGHVTKEGDIAGPKTLEHMVDAVIHFEGDPVSNYRVLRAHKNRFGTTDEIGVFEMVGNGLREVNDPLAFIDQDTKIDVPGRAVVGLMEGKRPLFYEIQTLTVPAVLAVPRRVVKGVNYNKVLLIIAVLRKHLNLSAASQDIYVNVVGGVELNSTAADLGIAASIYSSMRNKPLSRHMLFTGEVGLLGEVRPTAGQDRIITEAKRLKFSQIVSKQLLATISDFHKILEI